MRRTVATVHGIQSDGAWQADVAAVLQTFFEVVPTDYDQFRRAGFPKVIGDIGAILRHRAVDRVAHQLSQIHDPMPIHVIAHSFGTHIIVRALEIFSTIQFEHVILCASVAPSGFGWSEYCDAGPGLARIRTIRNEIGKRDWITKLAGISALTFLAPHLGWSGTRLGFSRRAHWVENPRSRCPQCHMGKVPVHNVMFNYRHSSFFVVDSHWIDYWVPTLLGYDAGEYLELIGICTALARVETDDEVDRLESALADSVWSWSAMRLWDFMEYEIVKYMAFRPGDINYRVRNAISGFWALINRGWMNRYNHGGDHDAQINQFMIIEIALASAVEAAAA